MEEIRCEHPRCGCAPEQGRHYCSDACEDAAQDDRAESPCNCGHPECLG